MNGRSRAILSVLLALITATVLMPPSYQVAADPTVTDAGGGFKNATWDFGTPADYALTNAGLSGGNATLSSQWEWTNYTTDADFVAAINNTDRVVVNGGVRLAGSTANLIADGTFDQDPGLDWMYMNGTTGNVSAARDPAAKGTMWHDTARWQFDSMDDGASSGRWSGIGFGATCGILSDDMNHVEGIESVRCDYDSPGGGYAGAQRILGGADWSAYNRLAMWLNLTPATPLDAYLFIRDGSAASDVTPQQTIASDWARYVFDLAPLAVDFSAVDILELRFTASGMTTATVYADDLVLFNHTAFDEAAKVSQTFDKPNATSGNPNSVILGFDVEATPSVNVISFLNVSVAGSVEWNETPVVAGMRRVYVDLGGNPLLQNNGSFVIEFALELVRTGVEEASMAAWIDNVTITATDYQNGTFTANVIDAGSAAIWRTTALTKGEPQWPITEVFLDTRTGNTTNTFDATWTGWAPTNGSSIVSPPNRYLQWRLRLTTTNGSLTPVVNRLEVVHDKYAASGVVRTLVSFRPPDLLGWRGFFASDARPPGTAIAYALSGDGSAWSLVTDGENVSARGLTDVWVRATLSTANTSLTPTVAWFALRFEYLGSVSRISVTPDNVTMAADQTQNYTATGYDAFDHPLPGIACLWSAGNGSLTNQTATTALYEPTLPGTWQIRCDIGSVPGIATVHVTLGALASIAVTPNPAVVNVTDSITFFAGGRDADGNAVALLTTAWSTTIGQMCCAPPPGTQATLQAGATEGTGVVTAREGTVTGSAVLSVLPLNAPRINETIPSDSRPEDSPSWALDLTSFAGNQFDRDDTLANLRWTMSGLGRDIVTVFGTGVFGRHTLDITPVPDAVGTDSVVLCLEDASGARACQAVDFTLTQVNDAPFWRAQPSVDRIDVLQGESYRFSFLPYVGDIDNPFAELSLLTSDPARISTDGLNATFTYGDSYARRVLYIELTVNDGTDSSSTILELHVTANPPPRVGTPLRDVGLDEDTTLVDALGASLDTFFADPAGDTLTFTALHFTHLDVLVYNTGAYVNVDIASKPNFCGTDRVTFRATDPQGAFVEDAILVDVRCVNDAPLLAWTEDVRVQYDTPYRLDLTTFVSDVDHDLEGLRLSTSDAPWASVDGFTVSFLYLWAPSSYNVLVTLVLSDGSANDSNTITVRVSDNAPPELRNPFEPLQFDEDVPQPNVINLAFHFQDLEDGDTLTYDGFGDKVAVVVSTMGVASLTPAQHWFGQEILRFRATDTRGAFAIGTLFVEVLPVNDGPHLASLPAQDGGDRRRWALDLRPYVTDVDDDVFRLLFTTSSANVRAVGYYLLFEFPYEDRTVNVRVEVSDGALTNSTLMHVIARGQGFWASIGWPWSGFAILAFAAVTFLGYRRWTERRYSFEDFFLVGREGRLVMHTTRRLRPDRDEDLLAGMLTAIVLFVRDSFREENEELRKFQFGERTVAVEKGAYVYGAAIFAGVVPHGVYYSLRHFLADVEERYVDILGKWSGDIGDLPGLKEMMQDFGRRGRYRTGDWKRSAS